MQTTPSTPFKMAKPQLLLEVLIVALDAPTQLGEIDQTFEGHIFRKVREPVFDCFVLAFWPLDQQPFFRAALGKIVIAMGDADTQARALAREAVAARAGGHSVQV